MASRRAATQVVKRCLDSSFGLSRTLRNPASLGATLRVFGSTSAYSNSAAEPASSAVEHDSAEDVDTVGWGSTKVGTLLKAKGIGSAEWLWCDKDVMVLDAIKKMTNANVGSLMVVDANTDDNKPKEDSVVGILTERDYLTKVVVKGRNSSNTKVSEIMTPVKDLIMVTPKHSVLDVMELMVEKNFRHVPVVETCGTMTGMVSIKDVVHVMLKEHREEVGRLNEYIQGTF